MSGCFSFFHKTYGELCLSGNGKIDAYGIATPMLVETRRHIRPLKQDGILLLDKPLVSLVVRDGTLDDGMGELGVDEGYSWVRG